MMRKMKIAVMLLMGGYEYDFDENRIYVEDNDVSNYPIFNPRTTFDPHFVVSQIFSTKLEFKKVAQSCH